MAYADKKKQKVAEMRYHNSSKGKITRKKYRDLWYKTESGRITSMIGAARMRAKKKNIEFSLTKKDILIPKFCPLLGLELSCSDFGIRHNSPSIDRKNPKLGYTPENIWVISTRANILKNNATLDELDLLTRNLRKCGFISHA